MLSYRGATFALGGGLLAVAGAAYGVEEFELVAFAAAVLFVTGFFVVWYRCVEARRSLQVGVRVPVAEVIMGQAASAELTVTNIGKRATGPFLVEDPARRWHLTHPGIGGRRDPSPDGHASTRPVRRLFGERPRLGDPLRLPVLRPGEQAVVSIPIPTAARGLLGLSCLGIWCEDPLRLVACNVAGGPLTHVLVCPRPERASNGDAAAPTGGASRPYDSDEHDVAQTQGGDEFRSLRPYVPGDRLTRLHWPASSRTGKLTVRDFVESVSGRVTLLVDLRASVHEPDLRHKRGGRVPSGPHPPGSLRSVEAVISRAAGLGLVALERGRVVELCTSEGERMEFSPGPGAAHDLLCALAVVGPTSRPPSSSMRWGPGSSDGAVWAATGTEAADVLFVTTGSGRSSALPESLARKAERVVVG